MTAVSAVACALALTVAVPCFADAPGPPAGQAELLFRRGRDALRIGRFEAAQDYLAESYRLDPSPGTLLNLALCEEKTGRIVSALAHLRLFLGTVPADDDRRDLAVRRLRDVEDRMPRLVIHIDEATRAAATLRLDGVPVDLQAARDPLPLDPGEHALVVELPGEVPRTTTLRVREHQQLVQVIVSHPTSAAPSALPAQAEPRPPRASAPEATPRTDTGGGRRRAALVVGGLGVVAMVGAAVAGFEVLADKRIVSDHCRPNGCDPEAVSAANDGRAWSGVGTTLGTVAVTGLAVGVALWVWGDGAGAAPSLAVGARPVAGGAAIAVAGSL
jgi:hypothetical protein